MKFLIKFFLIIFFVFLPNNFLNAVEINCSSPVHKNKPRCKGKGIENSVKKEQEFDSWFPVAFNENRIAVGWVQFKSYEELNENSFRVRGKWTYPDNNQYVGKLDINCKNKDFYFRPQGLWGSGANWAAIPQGSGVDSVARYFCRRTAAKNDWGYKDSTAYLWDIPAPTGDPANLNGEWIQYYDKDDGEAYYNTAVIKKDNSVIYGMYYRLKKGDRSAAQPSDTAKYQWVNNSCTDNLGSEFYQPDISVPGIWLAPTPGRPGGSGMIIRKEYCN